jgi:hypothetical protein
MNTFDKKFWKIFIPFIILILIILFLPYLITTRLWFDINFTTTGPIGDTIGGILGPFIALAAAILTFFAFWVQYQANEQQKTDLKIERFENKFYELLKLHKENVNELYLAEGIIGRKTFVHLTNELRACYKVCEKLIKSNEKYSNINIMNFSYKIFFYGIGEQSEEYYVGTFNENEKKIFPAVRSNLQLFQERYKQIEQIQKKNTNYKYDDDISMNLLYYPFNGHVNKLGHYFRHLFQTSRFVIDEKKSIIDEVQKYEYIKMLRAQLTDHEQLLMYYNGISWYEKEWKELFTTFRLIKNIPITLANFDKSPLTYYSNEINKQKKYKIFSGQKL